MHKDTTTCTTFTRSDTDALAVPMKVGLLATVNEQGLPHLTLLSTLQAGSATQVIWGQFTEGLSKRFVRQNPQTGFLILTLDRHLWRGKARWTHVARAGPEFDMYNNLPMFRYNAYFGVHTVYYMDLVEHYGRQALPMPAIVAGAIKTALARRARVPQLVARRRGRVDVLNPWTRRLIDETSNLKFLAYVPPDGYPHIIPVIQAQAWDSARLLFAASAYRDELEAIPAGAIVAFFALSLDMEDVLLRGTFRGIRRTGGVRCGVVDVDWVYNPMPPKPGQIYPPLEIEPITSF